MSLSEAPGGLLPPAAAPTDPEGRAEPVEAPAASQELERPAEILNPVTGQLVPASDLRAVGEAVEVLRRARGNIDAAVAAFTGAVAAEVARVGSRTLNLEGMRLVLGSDSEVLWDVALLARKLRAAGCPEERLEKLIKVKVEETVDGTVARQLAGANPVYKDIIESCKQRVPKRPSVRIER